MLPPLGAPCTVHVSPPMQQTPPKRSYTTHSLPELAVCPPPPPCARAQGPYWSLMFEVSESYLKPVNQQPITLAGTAGEAEGRPSIESGAGGGAACGGAARAPGHAAPASMQLPAIWQSLGPAGQRVGQSLPGKVCEHCRRSQPACPPVRPPIPASSRPVPGTWPEVVRETLIGAINTKLCSPKDEIVSIFHRRLEHGEQGRARERLLAALAVLVCLFVCACSLLLSMERARGIDLQTRAAAAGGAKGAVSASARGWMVRRGVLGQWRRERPWVAREGARGGPGPDSGRCS